MIYYYLSALLLAVGLLGLLIKKDLISMVLCINLMVGSVSLLLIQISKSINGLEGQVLVWFVIVVLAMHIGVGLSLIISLFREKKLPFIDDITISSK